jgi:PEP-CTERM motif
MKFLKMVAAAALAMGAVAANATFALPTVVTFSQFSLGADTPTTVAAVASADDGIVSFSLVTALPSGASVIDDVWPDVASLTFLGLTTGNYTLRLETLAGAAPVAMQVTVNGAPLNLTAVPEPETYALALAGLAVAGLMARRGRAAA